MQAALLRLMTYTCLSRTARLGPEDRVCVEFATRLRQWTLEGRLRAVWSHPANELCKPDAATAVARALGLITGTPDYLFLGSVSAALEAKAPGAYPNPGQKDFRDWCATHGVPWRVFRSADEGETILRELGILT